MTQNRKPIVAGAILILAILACNGPFSNPPQQSAPEIQTAAAQALEVIFTPGITETAEPLQSPKANTPIATATQVGVATHTPTYSVPIITVRESTNCRTGPGQDYEVIFTYLSGKELEIIGRYDQDNYWLVKSAESPTG